MYCIERCLSFTLVPLKKNSYGEKHFSFNGRTYDVTYYSNFNYKHFALIDCITHYLRAKIFNEFYKKSDQDKPPYSPRDFRIIDDIKMHNSFTDKDFVKFLYINDDMVRSHPMFRSWKNGWEIFNFLEETSKIEFENLKYYYVLYNEVDKSYSYRPVPIINKCNLFDVTLSKKKRGCNLYKIEFNSLFGKIFAYNINVANFSLVQDKFYELDGIGQSLYRFFTLFRDGNIDIDIEKIFELLEYDKTTNRTNLTRKIISQFEMMKNLKLIKNYTFKYDVFEVKR